MKDLTDPARGGKRRPYQNQQANESTLEYYHRLVWVAGLDPERSVIKTWNNEVEIPVCWIPRCRAKLRELLGREGSA